MNCKFVLEAMKQSREISKHVAEALWAVPRGRAVPRGCEREGDGARRGACEGEYEQRDHAMGRSWGDRGEIVGRSWGDRGEITCEGEHEQRPPPQAVDEQRGGQVAREGGGGEVERRLVRVAHVAVGEEDGHPRHHPVVAKGLAKPDEGEGQQVTGALPLHQLARRREQRPEAGTRQDQVPSAVLPGSTKTVPGATRYGPGSSGSTTSLP